MADSFENSTESLSSRINSQKMVATVGQSHAFPVAPQSRSKKAFYNLPQEEQALFFSWIYQKSPHTGRYYKRIWLEFLSLFDIPIASFREIQISHLVAFLKTKGHLKPASRNLAKNSLSSFLSFLSKTGFLDKNPGLTLEPIKVPDRMGTKILSQDQIYQMYDKEKSSRNRAIIKLLYFSGIRVGELCNLKMSDVRPRSENEYSLQILGKGGVVRHVLIPKLLMNEIYGANTPAAMGIRAVL